MRSPVNFNFLWGRKKSSAPVDKDLCWHQEEPKYFEVDLSLSSYFHYLELHVFSLYFLQSGHLENCSFWRFIIHLYQKNPAILCQCFKAEEKCFKVLTSRWCHNTGELNLRDKTIVWLRNQPLGSPGGTVVKNPPANARDTGSIPGPGKSHMPRNNEAHAPQLLSPHATITEACAPRARAPQRRAARRN